MARPIAPPPRSVTDIAPTLTAPVISGVAQEGQTLTATAAVANDSDATVSYQWQARSRLPAFASIAGATGLSYVVQEADEGATAADRCDLDRRRRQRHHGDQCADRGGDWTSRRRLTTPAISGAAQEGQTLTATAAVANDSDATVSYQWQADHGTGFVSIAGATGLSYVVQEGRRRRPAADRCDLDRRRRQRHHGDQRCRPRGHGHRADADDPGDQRRGAGRPDPDGDGGVANDSDATVSYQWQADHGTRLRQHRPAPPA